MTVTIREAEPTEAGCLSALAQRSKAHWGYSEEFMQACVPELTFTAESIVGTRYRFVVAENDSRVIGFYAIEKLSDAAYELEALFVEPDCIGQGVGRQLIQHALTELRQTDATSLLIQGDPNAESFYKAAGGKAAGERESLSVPGRMLPLFEVTL